MENVTNIIPAKHQHANMSTSAYYHLAAAFSSMSTTVFCSVMGSDTNPIYHHLPLASYLVVCVVFCNISPPPTEGHPFLLGRHICGRVGGVRFFGLFPFFRSLSEPAL